MVLNCDFIFQQKLLQICFIRIKWFPLYITKTQTWYRDFEPQKLMKEYNVKIADVAIAIFLNQKRRKWSASLEVLCPHLTKWRRFAEKGYFHRASKLNHRSIISKTLRLRTTIHRAPSYSQWPFRTTKLLFGPPSCSWSSSERLVLGINRTTERPPENRPSRSSVEDLVRLMLCWFDVSYCISKCFVAFRYIEC